MYKKQMLVLLMMISSFFNNVSAMYTGEIEFSTFEIKDEDRLKRMSPYIETPMGKFYQYPEPSEDLQYTIDISLYKTTFESTIKVNLSIARNKKIPRIVRILHAEKALRELDKIIREIHIKQGDSVEDNSSKSPASETFSQED
jgi:hypothetical protein